MLITQTSGNAANPLASGLFAAINNAPASSPAPGKPETESAPGSNAATQITLSAEAQQRLASDKAAAEKLASAVANDNNEAAPGDTSKDLSFDSLFDMAERNIPKRKGESTEGGLTALPEEQMRASMKEATMKLWTGALERKNPEQAAAFKEAIANGTARIRLASDVPGANARTSVTYFDDNKGMQTSHSGTNSTEIQEMLDSGNALMTWKHGVGDLFITW